MKYELGITEFMAADELRKSKKLLEHGLIGDDREAEILLTCFANPEKYIERRVKEIKEADNGIGKQSDDTRETRERPRINLDSLREAGL